MSDTHRLKTWPKYFYDIRSRNKTFEVRKADRDYKVDDTLVLCYYDPEQESYNGEEETRLVTYVLTGGAFGIQSGFVVLGLR